MRAREAGIFDDARQRCRIIARKNSVTSSREHDFIVFFLSQQYFTSTTMLIDLQYRRMSRPLILDKQAS